MNEPAEFENLKAFILDRLRMRTTHICKPIMLQAMLRRDDKATKNEVAGKIIFRDELQIEHYPRYIIHQMPDRRLVRDGIIEQYGGRYHLTPPLDTLSDWHRPEPLTLDELLQARPKALVARDLTLVALDVSVNTGLATGQTKSYAPVHLIPRRHGEVDGPQGALGA